jgi:hypothetical protein
MNASRARLPSLTWGLLFPFGTLIAPACGPTSRPVLDVVPHLDLRLNQAPGPDTVVYRRTITRGGQDSSAGTRTVVLRKLAAAGGSSLLEVEQRFPGGGGEILDTALAELRTLRAVAHRSHQPTRTMRFSFAGNYAEGTVGDSVVRQALGGPIFDSNVLDLVVAALPLVRGFTVELPFFIYERGGRVPLRATVQDRGAVAFAWLGQRDAWVVAVGVPGAPATVWIDTETRAVLRVRYDISARGISVTDERVTALRR